MKTKKIALAGIALVALSVSSNSSVAEEFRFSSPVPAKFRLTGNRLIQGKLVGFSPTKILFINSRGRKTTLSNRNVLILYTNDRSFTYRPRREKYYKVVDRARFVDKQLKKQAAATPVIPPSSNVPGSQPMQNPPGYSTIPPSTYNPTPPPAGNSFPSTTIPRPGNRFGRSRSRTPRFGTPPPANPPSYPGSSTPGSSNAPYSEPYSPTPPDYGMPPGYPSPTSAPPTQSYTPSTPSYPESPSFGTGSPPPYESNPSSPVYGDSTSPEGAPGPDMSASVSVKMCSNCMKEVPNHITAGDRCPHCHVRFDYDETNGKRYRVPGAIAGLGALVSLIAFAIRKYRNS